MLKKLIKHDLKYGVRMFAVLHIILIIGCRNPSRHERKCGLRFRPSG